MELYRHLSEWDLTYTNTKFALLRLLGDAAQEIQHIGSTAIHGILSRPIVDIGVALRPGTGIADTLRKLYTAGCRLMPPDESHYVHLSLGETVCVWLTYADTPAWADWLAFRNYLNAHVFAANAYEKLRTETAPADYDMAKSDFIRKILRLSVTDKILGERVTVHIDRPLGSVHPKYPNIVYKLNYGYIDGVTGGDGEPQDAYVYGVPRPAKSVTGTVIAVIHRRNDNEDKLVVAPSGTIAYEPQLRAAVNFVEQYFDTFLICIYEKSCGAIIYRKRPNGAIEYLIVFQEKSGTWSIPKGHIAEGETERETALREVYEETGLRVALTDGFRREMTYTVSAKASKNLVIFLAQADGDIVCGENEISDYLWADRDTAIRKLGGRSIGHVIEAADWFIRQGKKRGFKRIQSF